MSSIKRSTVLSVVVILAFVFSLTSFSAVPALPLPHPTLTDYQFISASTTPPTTVRVQRGA